MTMSADGKRIFYSEAVYVVGVVVLAVGTALVERAGFGVSMVVAPAYLLHLKLSAVFPAYTFGVSEYVLQAVLLLALSLLLRRFKKGYLFSFLTAFFYGCVLDISISALSACAALLPAFSEDFAAFSLAGRLALYFAGLLVTASGVSLLFHTYLPPEAYELFVKEVSGHFGLRLDKVKTAYDCISLLTSIALSFLFFGFGQFRGIGAGTVFCALVNGRLIGKIGAFLEARCTFRDALPWRDFFSR